MSRGDRSDKPRRHVVIVGGGFGGLARALAGADVDVTLVDKRTFERGARLID